MRDPGLMLCVVALAAILAIGAIGAGCDSNPTPHPQGDVVGADARMDTVAPGNVADPDEDGDGVGDCTQAGGFWDGESCRSDIAGESDATAGIDGAELGADGDASDGEAQDGADGGDEDGAAGGDAAESDSGPDVGE